MSKERWKHSASFNAKVTLEAIKGEETVALLEGAAGVFGRITRNTMRSTKP